MRFSVVVIFWSVTIFLALCLVTISAGYFNFDLQHHFLMSKQDLIHNSIWLGNFYVHLFAGILAVLSGLFLFFNKLIPFKSKLHKGLGRTYVFAILFLSGPTGFYLSFFAEGGPAASVGFLLMSSSNLTIFKPTFFFTKSIAFKSSVSSIATSSVLSVFLKATML